MELNVQATARGASVSGEMTIYSASALKAGLLEAGNAHAGGCFELDLSAVTEFDSAGLQLLLMLSRGVQSASREFRIVACSDTVRSALQLCRQEALISGAPAG